jgi:hypothetical protein
LLNHACARFGTGIETNGPMTTTHHPFGHVGTHAAQANHSQFHALRSC